MSRELRLIKFSRRMVAIAEDAVVCRNADPSASQHASQACCFARDDNSEEIRNENPGVRAKAAVCRVNFMVKLLRAHGGCLGRSRRRRTWQAAISLGEPQAGFDPGISEWGNPRGQNPRTAR